MTILTHIIAMIIGTAIGWCFIALFVVQPLRCKVRYREREITELRQLAEYWHGKFWKEVQINTELRNYETCRN